MKKFNILEMKTLTNCKKNHIGDTNISLDELKVIYPNDK